MTSVRPPAVAGTLYPADPMVLARDVDDLLSGAKLPENDEVPKALVVPHAGYVYSGPIAASAYRALARWARGRDDDARIVLLGPAHRARAVGLVLPAADILTTPLGSIPVDRRALADLTMLPQVSVSAMVHEREHSLEVHLPFLQRLLHRFTIVPLAVGDATPLEVAEVLDLIWGGDETKIIVSSDLSRDLPYATARRVDLETADAIERGERLDQEQACGARAMNGLAEIARRRGLSISRLDLRSSGDTAGWRHEVVGYGAFAYYEPTV